MGEGGLVKLCILGGGCFRRGGTMYLPKWGRVGQREIFQEERKKVLEKNVKMWHHQVTKVRLAGRTPPSILDIVSCGLWQCVIVEENGLRQERHRELI